jgi:hypothetical protein
MEYHQDQAALEDLAALVDLAAQVVLVDHKALADLEDQVSIFSFLQSDVIYMLFCLITVKSTFFSNSWSL